ncbi:MAG: PQQ-dependent sugar dehydrogenase [Acidimicrobiia bacterium]
MDRRRHALRHRARTVRDLDLRARDEINRIEAGGFYGWPFVAGDDDTGQGEPPADPIAPVATSGPDTTWAPSGMAAVGTRDGDVLLVAALRGEALLRFDVAGDRVVPQGAAADGLGRLRVVELGPDGCLYLATSNTDGRGSPAADDDRILRSC